MRITVPHCGQMDIFINAVCRKIGPDFIIPPKTSPRTLSLGIKYSPESTCLPFKFILGNFIEALEKGADTICMISDHGPCRVGMYDIVMQNMLREMGVEVTRTMWFTSQIAHALRLDLLKKRSKSKAIRASKRYLPHNIGGECNASIGYAILYAREGYNGVIQLLPFGCMLESVANSILRMVSKDHDIPVLTFSLAENLSETTIMTRLSAFVDLIHRRRKGRERCP